MNSKQIKKRQMLLDGPIVTTFVAIALGFYMQPYRLLLFCLAALSSTTALIMAIRYKKLPIEGAPGLHYPGPGFEGQLRVARNKHFDALHYLGLGILIIYSCYLAWKTYEAGS